MYIFEGSPPDVVLRIRYVKSGWLPEHMSVQNDSYVEARPLM